MARTPVEQAGGLMVYITSRCLKHRGIHYSHLELQEHRHLVSTVLT